MTDRVLDVDHLVVGAGAMGMAFTDALIAHSDARVALVDRRHAAGGHWLAAYPFVRLHQASSFYGVDSTVLGGGRVQQTGPEAGLYERAGQPAIVAYYEQVLADRLVGSGQVEWLPGCEVVGREVVSRVSGARVRVSDRARIVDARYLAPDVPAELPPRFAVGDGARVVPVNALAELEEPPSRYVVVGSGKTATDAVVWLLSRGVDPGDVTWVRPREPWMLDRAVVQPAPEVYLGMVATMMELAAGAASLDALFAALEDAGVMLRIDRTQTPTMAKAPTLGRWELDLLRTVEDVVRLGRVRVARPGELVLEHGSVALPAGALVVNCAADGLKNPPRVPVWGDDALTLQPVRAGFPCFGAALTGYVEATRGWSREADATKNALVAPSSYGNTLEDWAVMNVLGLRNTAAFSAEPDIAAWADACALNASRVPPDHPGSAALDDARERLARWRGPGVARLEQLAGL